MNNKVLLLAVILLTVSGCIGFQSVQETTADPKKSIERDYQLDTPEKKKYWNELKENNDRAIIIINDTKK